MSVPVLSLASTSPRRRQLLTDAGIAFELHPPADEPDTPGEPRAVAMERALAKAGGDGPSARWILAVDTVVDLDGVELGKAATPAIAAATLRRLQGRTHEVHTAHVLRHPRGCERELASARVRFEPIGDAEIDAYVASDDWRGKAGAYGIQDQDAWFVGLEAGALDTVIGLHVAAVRRLVDRAQGVSA